MRKFVTIIKVKNYTAMTSTAVMGKLSSYLQECPSTGFTFIFIDKISNLFRNFCMT